jgi:hypothetical protein
VNPGTTFAGWRLWQWGRCWCLAEPTGPVFVPALVASAFGIFASGRPLRCQVAVVYGVC